MLAWLKSLGWNVVDLLDQAGNVATGGAANETISSRAGKARAAGKRWGCVLCAMLDWVQANHCARAMAKHIGDGAEIPDGE